MNEATYTLRCGAWSERGIRERNEDCAAYNGALGFLVIADGMGGHPSGDEASAQVIDEVLAVLESSPSPQDVLIAACLEAHEALASHGDNRGSTLTAAVLTGDQLHVAHVGDTRLYLDEAQVTTDQGEGQVLHQFIGGEDTPDILSTTTTVQAGSWIVLTTDGIHGVLEIDAVVLSAVELCEEDPATIARTLAHSAIQAGSTDNCTCVVAEVIAL
jgi:protein phosphatase